MAWLDKLPKPLKNRYLLTGTAFIVWLLFFDDNNVVFHSGLIKKKAELKQEYQRLRKETYKNKVFLKSFNDPDFLERFAREKYLMKKDNEDVFIVESKKDEKE